MNRDFGCGVKLSTAFSLGDKDVVALIGGGGKTTTMFRLAAELVTQGKRVVTTTTTRIFASQIQLAPQHIFAGDDAPTLDAVRAALERQPHVLVIGAANQAGKAFGVRPALVDQLIALDAVDHVIVEADGSRMRPFKAPGEHEPVTPQSTTLLVPTVGIDAVGKLLNDENVHRAELVAQLAGTTLETPLTAEHIARVLTHPQGGLKNRPARARVIPFINKVETPAQQAAALEIAERLLRGDEIAAVAIGAVQRADAPIARLETRVAAVILAAGGSTRMRGETKQLLAWGDTTFVGNAARVARQARVAEIVVVTGHRADEVARALGDADARLAFNPDWASGRASSVRAGIRALRENCDAALFINADQPFLTPEILNQMIARYAATRAPIIVPTFDGQTGSPVLFARSMFDELAALTGDVGGKTLLEKYRAQTERVAIADARGALDLDTPEEYANARAMPR